VINIRYTHVRLQFFDFGEDEKLDWDNPNKVTHQWRSECTPLSLPEEKLITLEDQIGDTIEAVSENY